MSLREDGRAFILDDVEPVVARRLNWPRKALISFMLILTGVFAVQCLAPVWMLRRSDLRRQVARAAALAQTDLSGPEGIHLGYDWTAEVAGSPDPASAWWIPLAEVDATGAVACRRLYFTGTVYALRDQIWAEPSSGRFARVIRHQDFTLYAQAFDGKNLYTYDPARQPEILREAVADGVRMGDKFPSLFTMTAALPLKLADPNLPHVGTPGTEHNAIWGRIRAIRIAAPGGPGATDGVFLIKIAERDGRMVEIDYQEHGVFQFYQTRSHPAVVSGPPPRWDLSDLRLVSES